MSEAKRDGPAEQLGQALGGRAQRERLLEALARRTAEVAHEDDARAVVDELLDGGQRRADARIVGDDAVGFTGTLKSTRTSTRLPAASSPSMDLMSAMNAPRLCFSQNRLTRANSERRCGARDSRDDADSAC